MITFACKTVDIKDVIRCSFNLSKTEYSLLTHFVKVDEKKTVAQLSDELNLERSTVQKAIQKLQDKDLIKRHQINIAGGGYRFIYAVEDKEALRTRLEIIVAQWYKNVQISLKDW